MNDKSSVASPVIKALTAIGASVGVNSWSEAAQFVAFCYTVLLIGEWVWKVIRRARSKRIAEETANADSSAD